MDLRSMTRETSGLAVVDDQRSLVADVILDKGIDAVTELQVPFNVKKSM